MSENPVLPRTEGTVVREVPRVATHHRRVAHVTQVGHLLELVAELLQLKVIQWVQFSVLVEEAVHVGICLRLDLVAEVAKVELAPDELSIFADTGPSFTFIPVFHHQETNDQDPQHDCRTARS